jgi:5-methylcytosine-specific restriction protein B
MNDTNSLSWCKILGSSKRSEGDCMSRYNPDMDTGPNLNAARRWAGRCLQSDGSILADNETLWTPTLLDELDRLFVQNYDEGEGSFIEKLKGQLQSGPTDSRKLMAEALWILMLFQSNASPEHKRETVREVWGWSGSDLNEKHPMLSDEVLEGLGSAGTAFNTLRWRELSYLLTLVRTFKRLSSDERAALLSDPWRFSKWLSGVPQIGHRQMRHILRYLLFPDSFERMASGREKRAVLAGFLGTPEREIKSWSDDEIDRKLLELRQQLEKKAGTQIDFYEGELRNHWQRKSEVRTWLLSWNPERWHWESLAAARQLTATGNSVTDRWSCASGQAREGDQVYLVRVGTPPKGMVARGTVLKAPYEAPHYDPKRAQAGETTSYVDVEFSGIRDAERDPIVSLEQLEQAAPHQTWTPQASGIAIVPAAAKAVSELWDRLPPVSIPAEARASNSQPSGPARNVILYGPPGTGKTHRLLTSYVPSYGGRFIQAGGKLSSEPKDGSVRRYEFITFHQSYSYEDFV